MTSSIASSSSASSIPETFEYNPLCNPEAVKAELETELIKQTALLVIAVIAFIAITVITIVLSSIFFPAGLTLVVTIAGVSIPFVFGFFFAKPYNKRLELLRQIETEDKVIERLDEESIKEPEAVMEARIAVADEEIHTIIRRFMRHPEDDIELANLAAVPLEAQVKLKKLAVDCMFYTRIAKEPTLEIPLDKWRVFHHKDLNYTNQIAMYADRRTAVSFQELDDDGNPVVDDDEKPVMRQMRWSEIPFRLRNADGSTSSITINNEKSITTRQLQPADTPEDPPEPSDNTATDNSDNET